MARLLPFRRRPAPRTLKTDPRPPTRGLAFSLRVDIDALLDKLRLKPDRSKTDRDPEAPA